MAAFFLEFHWKVEFGPNATFYCLRALFVFWAILWLQPTRGATSGPLQLPHAVRPFFLPFSQLISSMSGLSRYVGMC
jgi:hypothetical protein